MDNNEAYEYLTKSYEDKIDEIFPELCNNSMEIYNKIESYNDIFHQPIIPHVEVKDYPKKNIYLESAPVLTDLFSSDNVQERYWINQCWGGLVALGRDGDEIYVKRLNTEADIIKTISEKLNNCLFEYFNTLQHYIDLFWECGSICPAGRGSSISFLSNMLMGITQIDPIEWNLAEWRFLNKERVELADVDIDLAPSKRPLIFERMRQERGELRVIQVATFGTEKTKSAIIAAARGYRSESCPNGIDNDTAQYISSLIPQERGFVWDLEDVVNGNPDKGRNPVAAFNQEMAHYPGLLDIIRGINNLVNKRSQHASGVILYNDDPWVTSAIMRSPNGDLITQFDLHREEALGGTKFDFLVTEICDKMINTINLLQKDGYFEKDLTLRQIYNKYLYPSKINLNDNRLWNNLAKGNIVSLFQFDSPVGGAAIQAIKPRNPIELMMANALTRLTGERGKERPLDRYVRMKNNINLWYKECRDVGLTEDEIEVLEPYYLPVSGCPTTQEKLMLLCMEPKLAHFSLAEANAARKVCSKKQLSKIPELHDKFVGQCPRKVLGEYVWQTAILPQLSYAFAEPHALAYSFIAIQILVLVTDYPQIYWDCGCLISDAGANEFVNAETIISEEEEEEQHQAEIENEDDALIQQAKKKKKTKIIDFGRISTAIGNFQSRGIRVLPPDINKSNYTFTPNAEDNSISYGLRGITKISNDIVYAIIKNRPYTSLQDFIEKTRLTKIPMINLIKSGAFDNIENGRPREEILYDYILSVSDQKKRVTLQNMQALSDRNLIPTEMEFYKRLFSFNKFLKKNKDGAYYHLNQPAINFISENFDIDLIEDGEKVRQTTWDKVYKKKMQTMSTYLKVHQEEMLTALNNSLYKETAEKYADGSISRWEMQSLSFYYHDHELAPYQSQFDDFFSLPEEPIAEHSFWSKDGHQINIYKLNQIIGTVIDKDKVRNIVTILTPTGVVNVKIYKTQFAFYDRQISQRGSDGVKHVIEPSWFKRGTLLAITGIRRDQNFIPKKYKNTPTPVLMKITIDEQNQELLYQKERTEVDDN